MTRAGGWGVAILMIAACLGGCANRVTPPDELVSPVTVYVADHGKHSSLLLPAAEPVPPGGPAYVQYAYGAWHCFALNNNGWRDYLRVALMTDRGALGREPIFESSRADLARRLKARVTPLAVERADAEWLRIRLDAAFDARAGEAIDNRLVTMMLVPYDGPNARYSLLNHCNHTTSRWLRQLGVRSPAWATGSRFEAGD